MLLLTIYIYNSYYHTFELFNCNDLGQGDDICMDSKKLSTCHSTHKRICNVYFLRAESLRLALYDVLTL